MLDLIRRSEAAGVPLSRAGEAAGEPASGSLQPMLPIHPPEVWGCGCTYETSASFRDAEHGTREGMYAYVYREPRPEIFFKGTARVCVGDRPADRHPRAIRSSRRRSRNWRWCWGAAAASSGYTLANDVSAWDIERENALYLPQSKVYDGCCALGPVMVTADELHGSVQPRDDLHDRARGKEIYSGATSTVTAAPANRDAGRVPDALEPACPWGRWC